MQRLYPELQDTAPSHWEFENEIGNGERYRFAHEYNCVFCHIASQGGGHWEVVVNQRPDSTDELVFQPAVDEWQCALALAKSIMQFYSEADGDERSDQSS